MTQKERLIKEYGFDTTCANPNIEKDCLMMTHPRLARQWHPTRNGKITPYDIRMTDQSEYWWICPHHQHELTGENSWKSTISEAQLIFESGKRCPMCKKQRNQLWQPQLKLAVSALTLVILSLLIIL